MFALVDIIDMNEKAVKDHNDKIVESKNVTIPKNLLWKLLWCANEIHDHLNMNYSPRPIGDVCVEWRKLEQEARQFLLPYNQ